MKLQLDENKNLRGSWDRETSSRGIRLFSKPKRFAYDAEILQKEILTKKMTDFSTYVNWYYTSQSSRRGAFFHNDHVKNSVNHYCILIDNLQHETFLSHKQPCIKCHFQPVWRSKQASWASGGLKNCTTAGLTTDRWILCHSPFHTDRLSQVTSER